jgi:serine/threonine protein kinase
VLDPSLGGVLPDGMQTAAGRRIGPGTPAYAAPEQLEGQAAPGVRADVHALGITVWEMLAGRHPYARVLGNPEELIRHQTTVMPAPLTTVARLPPEVDEVVRRAIAKDPADRYGSMLDLARALADLSAWIEDEAQAGRLRLVVPAGEPPLRVTAAAPDDDCTPDPSRAPTPPPPVSARVEERASDPSIEVTPDAEPPVSARVEERASDPSIEVTPDAEPPSEPEVPPPRVSRWPVVMIAAGLALLGAVVLSRPSRPRPRADASSSPLPATTVVAPAPPPVEPPASSEPVRAQPLPTASASTPSASGVQPPPPSATSHAPAVAKPAPTATASAAPTATASAPPVETHRAPFQVEE